MKFAGFPKFSVLSLLAGVFALALAGCGGTNNLALTEGNWSVSATSTAAARAAEPTFLIGGNLTQSKSTVSGTMYVAGSLCFPLSQPLAITGTVKDKTVTLTTADYNDQVITITGTATDASTLSGTYKVTGSGCDGGDQGTVSAVAMSSITGTWSGPISTPELGVAATTLSLNLTQSTTVSEGGTFPLTGTVTYTNSSCSVSGTIKTISFIAGQSISIDADTIEQDSETPGRFTYTALLNSASAPTSMIGDYVVDSGLCEGQQDSPTLTKQ
jgi:hypothetical protein